MEVGPPSNVTIRVKVVTNPGRSFAAAIGLAVPRRAGVVPRAGCAVIERQKTGRVIQVEAANLHVEICGRACCKAVASSFPCLGGTKHYRDDERMDG